MSEEILSMDEALELATDSAAKLVAQRLVNLKIEPALGPLMADDGTHEFMATTPRDVMAAVLLVLIDQRAIVFLTGGASDAV